MQQERRQRMDDFFICQVCNNVIRYKEIDHLLRSRTKICYVCSDMDDLYTLAGLKERCTNENSSS
jgi:hypothetical protein